MVIGIRDFKNQATQVLRSVEEDGTTVVVSRHGRPTALIIPVDSPEGEDYVLSHAPEILSSLRDADKDLREAKTTRLADYRKGRGI